MGIKVTKRLDLSRNAKQFFKKVNQDVLRDLDRDLADAVVERILSGKSPVKGKTFVNYSPSYAKVKGRNAPVDMLKTGDMLESITVERTAIPGSFSFGFNDEKSEWHNKGLGNLPKRRLLPTGRAESFAPPLFKKLLRIMNRAVRRNIRLID